MPKEERLVMNESASKTLLVAAVLCGVCSVMVATAVVFLKPQQELNQELDVKQNILLSAGLYQNKETIKEIYEKNIEPVVVDLATGEVKKDLDAEGFDQQKADKDPGLVEEISKEADVAAIRKRAKWQKAYLVRKDGKLDQVILHVYGKGLWSTMKGFVAVDKDGVTVRGFNYYSHGETPGLGGEIENPSWIAQWAGKKLYDESGQYRPKTKVIKGKVNPADPNAPYSIDGLSGATLTSKGVEGTFQFWFSDQGYQSFLKNIREGKIS